MDIKGTTERASRRSVFKGHQHWANLSLMEVLISALRWLNYLWSGRKDFYQDKIHYLICLYILRKQADNFIAFAFKKICIQEILEMVRYT